MDTKAWEELFHGCKNAVERFVYFKIPAKADAEDVIQEVFLTAFQKFSGLKDPLRFKAWILSIARSKCADYYRSKGKAQEIPLDSVPEGNLVYGRMGFSEPSPVRETMALLDRKDREILELTYFRELSQAQISSRLQIPLGTVKSRLHTAKKHFREKYPFSPDEKGAIVMKKLPELLPEYTIEKLDKMFAEQGLTNMHTFKLQARYPKGAERVLVYEITGQHMAAGVLPADLGVILSNVTSVAFVGQYFRDGVPLIKKRMTVDGDAVAQPKNIIAPIGTLIHDVIEFCGGYKQEPRKILMGGPMMGRAIFSDAMPIVKNNNAILAFSKEKSYIPEETACINCGRCHQACPFNLLPTALADAYERRDAQALSDLQVMQCMECGSCSFVCPARRPLGFINKLGKAVVKEAGIK